MFAFRILIHAALPAAALLAMSATPSPLDSLADAERSFSAMSVEKGMRDAFVANLAPDGVIFRPRAVNGQKVWQARGAVPGTLIWEPSFAEISGAGDLGFTTGPWEFRPPADSTGVVAPDRIAHGHFISVWQKQPDGAWKVALDIGCNHERPERGLGSGEFTAGPSHAPRKRPKPTTDLGAIERRCLTNGQTPASSPLGSCAAADVRYDTEGALPALGPAAVRTAAALRTGTVRWIPEGMGIASSDDLGYTYGNAVHTGDDSAGAPPDTAVYAHLWRKDAKGNWKITIAVENPLPRR